MATKRTYQQLIMVTNSILWLLSLILLLYLISYVTKIQTLALLVETGASGRATVILCMSTAAGTFLVGLIGYCIGSLKLNRKCLMSYVVLMAMCLVCSVALTVLVGLAHNQVMEDLWDNNLYRSYMIQDELKCCTYHGLNNASASYHDLPESCYNMEKSGTILTFVPRIDEPCSLQLLVFRKQVLMLLAIVSGTLLGSQVTAEGIAARVLKKIRTRREEDDNEYDD